MHKNKPNKGLLKRIKITKTGKVKRRKPFGRHYKANKSGKRKRHLRGSDLCVGRIARNMKVLIAPGR